MLDTDYAYAVARVRAKELSLLTVADLQQIIAAENIKEAIRILADKGISSPETGIDLDSMIEAQLLETWRFIEESVPDITELKALIVENDFQNLKAALRNFFTDVKSNSKSFLPCLIAPETVFEAVNMNRFELLPDFLRNAAQQAYDLALKTGSGRLIDIILDKAALETKIAFAGASGCQLISECAKLAIVYTNIKTAFRCLKMGKDADFIKRLLPYSEKMDNDKLVEAAVKSEAEFIDFVSSALSPVAADQLNFGAAQFEKWCDEQLIITMRVSRLNPFGLDAVAAYYLYKETEMKNLRIILTAKLNNISTELISASIRRGYA